MEYSEKIIFSLGYGNSMLITFKSQEPITSEKILKYLDEKYQFDPCLDTIVVLKEATKITVNL